MFRRNSFSFRATRALIAPLTAWCLGCSGFEPIVDALMGGAVGSAMVCAGAEGDASGASMAPVVEDATGADATAVSAPTDSPRTFDCGCGQSCHGVSPIELRDPPRASPSPQVSSIDAVEPPGVVRTPLLPPPEPLA